jgi:hypothetical protein
MSKAVYPEVGGYSIPIHMQWARIRTDQRVKYLQKDRRVIADDNLLEGL